MLFFGVSQESFLNGNITLAFYYVIILGLHIFKYLSSNGYYDKLNKLCVVFRRPLNMFIISSMEFCPL